MSFIAKSLLVFELAYFMSVGIAFAADPVVESLSESFYTAPTRGGSPGHTPFPRREFAPEESQNGTESVEAEDSIVLNLPVMTRSILNPIVEERDPEVEERNRSWLLLSQLNSVRAFVRTSRARVLRLSPTLPRDTLQALQEDPSTPASIARACDSILESLNLVIELLIQDLGIGSASSPIHSERIGQLIVQITAQINLVNANVGMISDVNYASY